MPCTLYRISLRQHLIHYIITLILWLIMGTIVRLSTVTKTLVMPLTLLHFLTANLPLQREPKSR